MACSKARNGRVISTWISEQASESILYAMIVDSLVDMDKARIWILGRLGTAVEVARPDYIANGCA